MKKEIFDILSSWHQEQKALLISNKEVISSPLELVTLSENISDEKQAAEAISCVLGDEIKSNNFFWGVPYSLHRPSCDFKLSSGYMYYVERLGWILIWKYHNQILFLDKNLFGVEKSFNFSSPEQKYRNLIENIKIRIIILLIFILLIIFCALIN